jgi:hypothetical protein
LTCRCGDCRARPGTGSTVRPDARPRPCRQGLPGARGRSGRPVDRDSRSGRGRLGGRRHRAAWSHPRTGRPALGGLAGRSRHLLDGPRGGPARPRRAPRPAAQPQRQRRRERRPARRCGRHRAQLADGEEVGAQRPGLRRLLRADQRARRAHQAGAAPGRGGGVRAGLRGRSPGAVGGRRRDACCGTPSTACWPSGGGPCCPAAPATSPPRSCCCSSACGRSASMRP